MSRILVVGGSDAGTMAALRARELDREVEITIVLADAYPNFSVCGLPFHVSREVEDWRALAHRSRDEFESRQIELLPDHEAVRIDPSSKELSTGSLLRRSGLVALRLPVVQRAERGGLEAVLLEELFTRPPRSCDLFGHGSRPFAFGSTFGPASGLRASTGRGNGVREPVAPV